MELVVKAKDVRVTYAGRDVLDIEALELFSYDRIGLIGDNGAGKTTLLRVLSGELTPEGCGIQRYGDIAYIRQMADIAPETEEDAAMRSRLGVSSVQAHTMSGGEETRMKIAGALSKQCHAILADEPTCHLDKAGIDFLIGAFGAFEGALLIISHDRYFLDAVVNKIWALEDGKITEYWGGYSDYAAQKEEERRTQALQYEQIRQERERLERAAEVKRRQAQQMEKRTNAAKKHSTKDPGILSHNKTAGSKQKTLHNAARHIEQRIAGLESVEAPENRRPLRFRQNGATALHNRFPIMADNLSLVAGDKTLLAGASFVVPLGAKVALTGANGAGKTTLLKAIRDGGAGLTISPKASIGFFEQTGYKYDQEKAVMAYMQENNEYKVHEIRAVLAAMGFTAAELEKPLGVLSGGEIIKLRLSRLLMEPFNILLLDEASNFLDIQAIEALESLMQDYPGTLLFVSHDQRLVDRVADTVFEIREKQVVTLTR